MRSHAPVTQKVALEQLWVLLVRLLADQEQERVGSDRAVKGRLRHRVGLVPDTSERRNQPSACSASTTRQGVPIRSLGLRPGSAMAPRTLPA